ncbi:MAG: YebC/PmpR family DNA-binding transcriptional regulator [Candidatus Pacebacteria bacterium]|nr:YebC/PmpR family DNA-binding transcriptional regulator [Candidatus Paceibacterota bacterium]MDD3434630.1 YebC/PmpR family DNA-binding transcriptional regulator [Candidatus Paceibacterota bacterium]
MSGHSKWAKVKHQKAANDPKKGQNFSKLANLIAVASREGKDIETNPKLRIAVEKAKEIGMPKENIEKAIKRGSGETNEAMTVEEVLYEAYGPQGSALLIKTITDNKNRTLNELRHLLSLFDSKLAQTGSVRWLFREIAILEVPKKDWNENLALEVIEQGAEEIEEAEETIFIYCSPSKLNLLKNFISERLPQTEIKTDLGFLSSQNLIIQDPETKEKIDNLYNALIEHNDVENVYLNVDFD